MATAHPEVHVVVLDENEGMGAAIAAGLGVAGELPYDYLWFVEDDSSPAADALSQQLAFLESNSAYSVVSQRARWFAVDGGTGWRGE